MKKIIILNGAPKKNGNTACLIKAFSEGAIKAGNEVKEFYLNGMNIKGCLDCQGCARKELGVPRRCVQQDDMGEIYDYYINADVIVFASPIYWFTITGTLKTAIDRIYAVHRTTNGFNLPQKETILLLTAGSPLAYEHPLSWYSLFEKMIGWKSLGTIFGSDKLEEAKALGSSII